MYLQYGLQTLKLDLLEVLLYLQHSRFLTLWPCQKARELGFNGNWDICTLAQPFYQHDDDYAPQTTRSSKLLAEWHQMKFNINDNIKPNMPIDGKNQHH